MEYLLRFAQVHESFRKPEIEAIAALIGIDVEFLAYHEHSPFCVIRVQDENAARSLIGRSILGRDIYELWGEGCTYEELRKDVYDRSRTKWSDYKTMSFKFDMDSYDGKRSGKQKLDLINSFAFLGLEGPIRMANPDQEFCIFERYTHGYTEPAQLYFGRWIAKSSRSAIETYDLKKRGYISTTSMDAELSLISANMALAAPGKVFYDPFVGTGSFCVAAAHFGAVNLGSDIDGRSFRGKGTKNGAPIGLVANLQQYGLEASFMDSFISDLTNTPLRQVPLFDGIMCDPPYGVREGLKVLGSRGEKKEKLIMVDGVPNYHLEGYVAPKRPYGFQAMLDDILEFAACTLVTEGRISLWMPTANEDDVELEIPSNPFLEMVSACVQPFNKWSRRLLTYRRLPNGDVPADAPRRKKENLATGSADDLNPFRKKYFQTPDASERSSKCKKHPAPK